MIASRIEKIKPDGILGVNIGPNKDSLNKLEDYLTALISLHHISDYITINISSPNTEGLRDFHNKDLMQNLFNELNKLKSLKKIKKPLVIKISPDIDDKNISEIIELILKFKIDGVIISNSSDGNRQNLSDKNKFDDFISLNHLLRLGNIFSNQLESTCSHCRINGKTATSAN